MFFKEARAEENTTAPSKEGAVVGMKQSPGCPFALFSRFSLRFLGFFCLFGCLTKPPALFFSLVGISVQITG
jgi:hypothetical protein